MTFRFEGLDIWHRAQAYSRKVYRVTARFPRAEDYGLTSPLNRAVNSVVSDIAEGSGKRSSKVFDYHLDMGRRFDP